MIEELVHSDRLNRSLASIVLSAAPTRKRDRCDAKGGSGSTGGDGDCSDFKSKKRFNSSGFSVPESKYIENREDISDDDCYYEVEDLALIYRPAVFREQRQLESPHFKYFSKEDEDEEDGLSPSFVGSHPTISRAKTIKDSSTDSKEPPEILSHALHTQDDLDIEFIDLDEISSERNEARGGEDSVNERERPEWLLGSSRPFVWTLPKKGAEKLFSVKSEIMKKN